MAFGECPADAPLRDAWRAFCGQLRAAGDQVFKDSVPANPLQRADAFRFLTQNLGQAFDLALETKDPAFPLMHPFCTPTRKLGGDAADFSYRQAWIDGGHAYRITGRRGTARFFNITVQGARPDVSPVTGFPALHEPFGDTPEANLFGHDLTTEVDGSFELFVGGPQRGPNWLPTTPQSRKLFIREGFDAWDETPTGMSIERMGMAAPRPLPTPETMMSALDWAGNFLTGMMRDWPDHGYAYSGGVVDPLWLNAFPPAPPTDGGDTRRGRLVAAMVWALAPNEALILSFPAHEGFWMASLGGAMMNSLDYLYRPVSTTPARTIVDRDGMVRLVLTRDDPGVHNWLDTQGFAQGMVTYRNLLGQSETPNETLIETRVVDRADLDAALPADTAHVTPAQRTDQLRARFAGIRQRYGL